MNIQELAQRIDSSRFFELDPELDRSRREREKNRLIELLYEYEMLLDRSSLEEMGLEFMEVFAGCIKAYVPGSFPFTHYFNAAFRKRKNKKFAAEKIDDFTGGIKMSDRARKRVYAVARFLDRHPDVSPDRLVALIGEYREEFSMTDEELKEAVCIYDKSHAQRLDAPLPGEEDGTALRDIIPGMGDISEEILNKEYMFHVMDVLDECYLEKRQDARPVISALVTSMLSELYDADPDYLSHAKEKAFFDRKVSAMADEMERPLNLSEIQQYLGRTNITNTANNFLMQVKKRLGNGM